MNSIKAIKTRGLISDKTNGVPSVREVSANIALNTSHLHREGDREESITRNDTLWEAEYAYRTCDIKKILCLALTRFSSPKAFYSPVDLACKKTGVLDYSCLKHFFSTWVVGTWEI